MSQMKTIESLDTGLEKAECRIPKPNDRLSDYLVPNKQTNKHNI